MAYFLGVDIGTTSLKAIAFNEKGEVIGKQAIGYTMQHPQPEYSELNPDEIFFAAINCINKTIESLSPATPAFVSFSSMLHSLIAVDDEGKPITNCIIWADNRASEIAENFRYTEEGKQFYHATGVPVHAMSPFCKLLWLKIHQPEIFNHAYKFIGIKEYIFFKLFDTYVIDTAVASGTGILNVHSLQWDKTILKKLMLAKERLSEVVLVEKMFYRKKNNSSLETLRLSYDIPFVIGSSDGALASLGAGAAGSNSMSVTIGTSAAVRILYDKPATEKNMSIFCYHAVDNQYIIGGASNNGAVVIQWLKETLLQTTESYTELSDLAKKISIGSDDLFFIPYILGERAPIWNANAKGVFWGLTINHTKAHMIRAAMEGVTYNLYSISKLITTVAPITQIYAAGGFAQNELWLQLVADVFNCKVLVSGTLESSALGAVMVGIKAVKLPLDIRPSIVSVHDPNTINHQLYLKQFQKFEHLYELFKNEFIQATISLPVVP